MAIVGNHDAGHLAVHPKMWVGIADEHQQAHRVIPPSYFVLPSDARRHDVISNRAELNWMAATFTPLTPQTAACMMASNPHSGRSMFADTRCLAIIWLNLSASLVSDSTCLYPNVGRQVTSGEMPLRKTKQRSRNNLNVTSAVVAFYTCRGSPALLLWSWWTAGWVSPQTSRSPGEIYLWGSTFPSKEWTPNLWSSADRQTWKQTGPSGSRGPRGSPLCAAPSPGKSPDCLRQTQNQQLIFMGKQVVKPRSNTKSAVYQVASLERSSEARSEFCCVFPFSFLMGDREGLQLWRQGILGSSWHIPSRAKHPACRISRRPKTSRWSSVKQHEKQMSPT